MPAPNAPLGLCANRAVFGFPLYTLSSLAGRMRTLFLRTAEKGKDGGAASPSFVCTGGIMSTPKRLRSEEHTSELQSLMRISYAVFCLKKKKHNKNIR